MHVIGLVCRICRCSILPMPSTDRTRPNMFSFDLPPDLKKGLQLVKERDGAPVAESIHRAIRAWLEQKDAVPAVKGRNVARGRKR